MTVVGDLDLHIVIEVAKLHGGRDRRAGVAKRAGSLWGELPSCLVDKHRVAPPEYELLHDDALPVCAVVSCPYAAGEGSSATEDDRNPQPTTGQDPGPALSPTGIDIMATQD